MTYTTKNVNGVDVPLTPEEIAELVARDAVWLNAQPKAKLFSQIKALEASITPRMIREDAAGSTVVDPVTNMTSTQMIANIDAQIVSLRAQLVALG